MPGEVSKKLLSILACPVCKKGLKYGKNQLKCGFCKRVYPVKKGVPVLLVRSNQ